MPGTIEEQLTLIISPHPGKPGHYDGAIYGIQVVSRTRTPFLAACRVLVGRGLAHATLEMRHLDSPTIALRANVGTAAQLTVTETATRKPVFNKWEAYPE